MSKIKNFSDLVFKEHPHKTTAFGYFNQQAKMFFDNGYGVSVITGPGAYSDSENPYELAVLKGNESEWSLTYGTSVSDDVVGYLNKETVSEYMEKVQKLERTRSK